MAVGGGEAAGWTFQDFLCARTSASLQSGGGLCHVLAMPRELGQLVLFWSLIALTLQQCWKMQGS